MSRSTMLLAFVTAILANSVSTAEPWVTYREAKERAPEEGRPIFLFFDLGDENSEFFLKEKFPDPRIQELARKFILARVEAGSDDVWKRYGVIKGPAIILCGSRGDMLEKGFWRSSDATYNAMKEALRRFGPVMAPALRTECDALTAEIKRAMSKKEYPLACAAANRLAGLTEENPYAERARVTLRRLGAQARMFLDRAAEYEKAGRHYEALLEFEKAAGLYVGTDEAKEAAKEIERYAKSGELRRLVAEQKDEVDSRRALEAAIGKDAVRPDLALEEWDAAAASWPDTPAGREAARLARERRADPAGMRRILEVRAARLCPSRLSIARSYIENGLTDKAIAILEGIREEFGGTSFEAEAKALLDSLR